jgi:hypothetical protein
MFEVELSSYFNAGHSPQLEFGCMLFQDWNLEEWARFDHFMINCLQYYLEHGLVAYEHKNLKLRKLINNTSREFVQWMEDKVYKNNQRIDYKVWLVDFMAEHEDFKKWLTQRTFNQWLKNYFDFKEIEMKNIVSNGIRFYELFNEELDYDTSREEAPF